jgi:hypothetical protein
LTRKTSQAHIPGNKKKNSGEILKKLRLPQHTARRTRLLILEQWPLLQKLLLLLEQCPLLQRERFLPLPLAGLSSLQP